MAFLDTSNGSRGRAHWTVRRALMCSLLAAALLALSASARGTDEAGVLALVSSGTTSELGRIHPLTLQPLPGARRVPVGLHDIPWAVAPDESAVAIGSGRTGSIVFVDLDEMRVLGRLRTGFTTALAWPVPERLLLLEHVRRQARVVLIDPRARRVLSRRALGRWSTVSAARTKDGLALLLAPRDRIGVARLLVVDASGRARRTALGAIRAGWERRDGVSGPVRIRYRNPGLAVDAEGQRAYVITSGTRVAEVELATLTVSDRHARRVAARVARPASPATPARATDGGNVLTTGTERQAHWLGDGRVAIAGANARVLRDPSGRPLQTDEPAGLSILDVRGWTIRTLAADVRWFHATAGLVLASVEPVRRPGTALAAFGPDGSSRFRLDLSTIWFGIQSSGDYAYLGLQQEYRSHAARVIDVRTGKVAATPRAPGWVLLLSPTQPQFCWCATGTTVG